MEYLLLVLECSKLTVMYILLLCAILAVANIVAAAFRKVYSLMCKGCHKLNNYLGM